MDRIVKILKIERLTPDVKRFIVEKPPMYKFEIGNAVMLAVNQPQWRDKERPFTFTSLPEDSHLEFIIKAYPEHNGVTKKLHTLQRGDELLIGEPFLSIEYKGPGVFLAGGGGVAGFIAILKQLKKEGKIEQCQLIYSSKTEKDIILEEWLKKLFKNVKNGLILVLTREKKKGYISGHIDKSLIEKYVKDTAKIFYVCGPPSFVMALKTILLELKGMVQDVSLSL